MQLDAFLLEASPNPFSRATTLTFEIPQSMDVDIVIYDVSGRAVRNLHSGTLTGGRIRLTWDGTNNGGRPVSPGVYFARLSSGRYLSVKRLVIVR
jgi:flagellar hook assembly protein FlgD